MKIKKKTIGRIYGFIVEKLQIHFNLSFIFFPLVARKQFMLPKRFFLQTVKCESLSRRAKDAVTRVTKLFSPEFISPCTRNVPHLKVKFKIFKEKYSYVN